MDRLGKLRRRIGLIALFTACVAMIAAALGSAPASASYGFESFDVRFSEQDATPGNPFDDPLATQAGSHPFAMTTNFSLNYTEPEFFKWFVDGQVKDLLIEQVKGLSGDATAYPQCSTVAFLTSIPGTALPECPDDTAVGVTAVNLVAPPPFVYLNAPVYNLKPPPGVPVQLGFNILNVKIVINVGVKNGGDYNVVAVQRNTPQPLMVFGAVLQLWGNPADKAHDPIRGHCVGSDFSAYTEGAVNFEAGSTGDCEVGTPDMAFLTLPSSCDGPAETRYETNSWEDTTTWVSGSSATHDNAEPPNPLGFTGCGKLGFAPETKSQSTTESAESPTGLDFSIGFNDEGLTSSDGIAQSTIKKAKITLPKGVTINPSVGEGLGVCTPGQIASESLSTSPGDGCPNSSKIGTVSVETPLLKGAIDGSVYLAEQDDPSTTEPGAENPFDSLIAFYIVLRDRGDGILVKLPAEVEPDLATGQLVTKVDEVPQLPFSSFQFHFREGQRAPLVSPPACGTYTTVAELTPWARPNEVLRTTSSFAITKGIGGGPCPPGGVPAFNPGFEAGSLNNNAGSYSPFDMRLMRADGEQDMTKFSAVLPPGVLGKLAGVQSCSDSAAAVAKTKTGRQELASPSCPAGSQIGTTLAGAGVGSALTYVGGKVYLGGPYKGAPLSVISVTPAVAGPFDAGTVVVRLGLDLNPRTAEVEVDGSSSDPIPHILKGIPLKVRELRVNVDRPDFTLNPTSCAPSEARATLFGGFVDVLSAADDVPVGLATRYQAANCLNLAFKPRLKLNLKGGTRRGGHPGLRAIYVPRQGDANIKGLVVRLPRSAFLDQSHIRTVCTRVQFAAKSCPKAARYGYVKAWTPLLDEPLQGPVYLRSSNHKLPDMVLDLHGLVDVEVGIRIDSAKGGIRATMEQAPDAPISKVFLRMQGGKKSLIVNSRNICHKSGRNRAKARYFGHNGRRAGGHPLLRAVACRKANRKQHRRGPRRMRLARSSVVQSTAPDGGASAGAG